MASSDHLSCKIFFFGNMGGVLFYTLISPEIIVAVILTFLFQVRGKVGPKPFKLPNNHEAFSRLSDLLVTGK